MFQSQDGAGQPVSIFAQLNTQYTTFVVPQRRDTRCFRADLACDKSSSMVCGTATVDQVSIALTRVYD